MANYFLTNKAVDDLAKIWDYTLKEWSERQADKYYLELIGPCEYISKNSHLGKNYDEIDLHIRGYLVNRHIIFYQIIKPQEMLILRILHASTDLKNRIP